MKNSDKQEKKTLKKRFLAFKINGLVSYKKYWEKELEASAVSDNKKAYQKYIVKEVERSLKKIEQLKKKLLEN